MIIYLYRWRLKTGQEEQFQRAWSTVTEYLREKGSLGSRLHVGDDGLWYGYAQWPSMEEREKIEWGPSEALEARESMKNAVAMSFPEIVLQPVRDYLERLE